MADSLTRVAGAQAQRIALDTENAILDGQMDYTSNSLNTGQSGENPWLSVRKRNPTADSRFITSSHGGLTRLSY
ncbi:hypothetical protein [Pectobacterium sp. B2J-2]|uniref:hypothetical protein n=1 Tax=Pectobacterium sp. B2J-2 TaxID=3385372 RepID=UPI0038FBF7F9